MIFVMSVLLSDGIPPGLKLKVFRTAKRWSQKDVERLSGIKQAFISELERGNLPTTKNMANRLEASLGITPEHIQAIQLLASD
jgi:transcriptional regulator with XRE-family HTH domain